MSVLDRPIGEHQEPGKGAAAVLTVAMHVLLALALFFGLRWQNRPPEAVSVELWNALPALPLPEPKPELPQAQPKPEPKPEPLKAEPKPDIALERARLERERRRVEDEASQKRERERKIKEVEARQKKLDEQKKVEDEKRLAEEKRTQEQERRALADTNRKRLDEQLNRELGGARVAAATPSPGVNSIDRASYAAKIQAKIKSNIVLPSELAGNPEAVFDVVQLPSGEVLTAKLRRSSGNRTYDEAVERAILKSSPLPRPDKPEQFERNLELKFRPKD